MTDQERAVMQQALEFVTSERWGTTPYMDVRVYEDAAKLRDAIRAALAQEQAETAQEPVAWIQPDHLQKARVAPFLCRVEPTQRCVDFVPLYTAPPQRKPLTQEEAATLVVQDNRMRGEFSAAMELIRRTERAHNIKE